MKYVSALLANMAILIGLALAAAQSARGNTLSYSDGDFSTNWSATQFGQTGSISASRIATGGNPGAYWTITNNVDTTNISAVSLRSDFTFTPSISGAIQNISFSYDAITQISRQGQGTAPALLQNGKLYEVQPENAGYYTSFTPLSFATLHAGSFVAFDGSGTHPDFSVAGSTIVLGFANSNSGTSVYSHRTTQSHYDNFVVSLNFTPGFGDYNGNGTVGPEDYNLWKSSFGSATNLDADGNGNGIVDAGDYTVWRDHLNAASLPLTGDYNHNGVVDGADYTLWRDTLGSTTNLAADGNSNGVIDSGDYTVWKANFGNHSGSGAASNTAVPEPSTLLMLLVGMLTLCCRRQVAVP